MERQLLQIANGLPADRFRHVIVTGDGCTTDDRTLPNHVTICHEPTRTPDPMWSRRLARVLREHRVDVLHIRNFAMLLDAVAAAELSEGVRIVFSFHGLETAQPNWSPWRARVYREALLRCDARWTVSARAVEPVCDALSVPLAAFDELPNGVDTGRFAPTNEKAAIRAALGLPMDRPIVLSVGNLKPVKGHEYLVQAVGRMDGDSRRACFVIVGQDYLGGRLQQMANQVRGVEIRFVGAQSNLSEWYQAADVFVLPSLWEGCSNALLEAMASGLACIATAVGGNVDLIEHDRTGWLVPPADAAALATAIGSLLHDPTRRNCLGTAARTHIEAQHGLSITLARYADRYDSVAGTVVG